MTTKSTEHTLELHFTDIFKRHEYKLYTLAFQLTKSDQYAKDIIQDVFLKLWQRRNNIAVINNPEALLYKLTEVHIVDFLNRAATDKRLRDALWVNMQHQVYEVDECATCKEYNQIIEKAIDQLPPQRQKIYQLQNETGFHYSYLIQELSQSGLTFGKKIVLCGQYLQRKLSALNKWFESLF